MGKVPKKRTGDEVRHVLAAVRCLARRANVKRVGAEILLAAALAVAGPDRARRRLRAAGVGDPDAVLACLPRVDPQLFDQLDPVQPDSHLAGLLRSKLRDFRAGRSGAEKAITILLAKANRTARVQQFLSNPRAASWMEKDQRGTVFLLKEMAAFYQRRWLLGHTYYTPKAKSGLSDFVEGGRDELFERGWDELYKDQAAAHRGVFAHRLYEGSLLGRCRRELGDIAAHTLGLVLLGELGHVGRGPLSVREIAWSLSPKYYHRHLAVARTAVQQLHGEELVYGGGDGPANNLGQVVLPTPQALEEFLEYLRREDPIDEQEAADLMKTLY